MQDEASEQILGLYTLCPLLMGRSKYVMCRVQAAAAAVKTDLMNRLNNAIKQRDAAREEALLATQKLNQFQEELDSGALTPSPAPSSLHDPGQLPAPSSSLFQHSMPLPLPLHDVPLKTRDRDDVCVQRRVLGPGTVHCNRAHGWGCLCTAGMIDRAQRYMPNAGLVPGHATPDSNGTYTPRTPTARRIPAVATPDGDASSESEVDKRQRELYSKQQHLLREQRSADQERLLACISGAPLCLRLAIRLDDKPWGALILKPHRQSTNSSDKSGAHHARSELPAAESRPKAFHVAGDLGFHGGRPLAALVIFRSCLQWKTFQADRTQLFDRIINAMGSQIEAQQENNVCLSYWLSNTVTLLYLLQKNIKPASGGSYNARLRSPASR